MESSSNDPKVGTSETESLPNSSIEIPPSMPDQENQSLELRPLTLQPKDEEFLKLSDQLQLNMALAFNVSAFDAFLSAGAKAPTHVFGHPSAIAELYWGDHYYLWYNARHPNRKLGWRAMYRSKGHHDAGVRMWSERMYGWASRLPDRQEVRLLKRANKRRLYAGLRADKWPAGEWEDERW
jgi:hypothetical protein